jgi:hypothetical protein
MCGLPRPGAIRRIGALRMPTRKLDRLRPTRERARCNVSGAKRVRRWMEAFTGHFPDEALAYREYVLVHADQQQITVGITLGDPEADTEAGRFAWSHNALAYGLVMVNGVGAPEEPIVWMVADSQLMLATAEGNEPPSEELRSIIELYLGLFFIQTAPIAPQLALFRIVPNAVSNDNHTVH